MPRVWCPSLSVLVARASEPPFAPTLTTDPFTNVHSATDRLYVGRGRILEGARGRTAFRPTHGAMNDSAGFEAVPKGNCQSLGTKKQASRTAAWSSYSAMLACQSTPVAGLVLDAGPGNGDSCQSQTFLTLNPCLEICQRKDNEPG
jgi:hypothetical protein